MAKRLGFLFLTGALMVFDVAGAALPGIGAMIDHLVGVGLGAAIDGPNAVV